MSKAKTFLTWATLAGLIALNYGFNNLVVRLNGLPLPIGHLLGGAALLIGAWEIRGRIREYIREPLVLAWFALLAFSLIHLLWDLSRFGLWAWRDASFVFEGVFLFLGFSWAATRQEEERFVRLLTVVLLLNLAYSLTYSLQDELAALTPMEGAFRRVSLLGHYSNQGFWLITGALFFLVLRERSGARWRGPLLLGALVQAGWSFLFQARSAYLGILLIVAVWWLFRGWRAGVRLTGFFAASFVVFLLVAQLLSAFGMPLQGRIGPVTPDFYFRHLSSVWIAIVQPSPADVPAQPSPADVPALGSARWRFDVWRQALAHWLATPTTMVVGEGFGQPLIDFQIAGGVVVRQPHNTHLTVLARLG
ncbi:hypothetical protein D6833_00275, partial [Candidatus Parcubacteria bacterium]